MSTSLAEQLKRLAVPQTNILHRDKKRASLLFDPKEAAGLRRETVYQIGLDGLEELILKNAIFVEYKNNLFHTSSRSFERAVQTEEHNKKLDKVIRKFLLHLSPYFLLNSTHKALEWLVNRFLIHEYNKEDFLMLVMPYHESNIFVRVIQLMRFRDENDSWYFLKSLQKPGVHLTKQALLSRASTDVYLLKFVSKFIALLIKEHEKPNLLTVAFNFYCTVFAGSIEYAKAVNEGQISQMLPALIKGLNSYIPDYCAASFVILGRLVAKTSLTDLVLDKFVVRICLAKAEGLKDEAVMILLLLYQTQKHYVKVPKEGCEELTKKSWFPKMLQDLNKNGYYIWPFLEALLQSCTFYGLREDLEDLRNFVAALLAAIKFDDSFVGVFLCTFLDVIKIDYTEYLQKWITDIMETLERQYPSQFDKEVYKILSSTDSPAIVRRKKRLQNVLKDTMTLRGKFDVFGKLYHPNPQFRSEAIKFLATNFESLRESEKEMIRSSFIDRLNDDDILVVDETLKLIKTISVLDKDTIRSVLFELAGKCQKDPVAWEPISGEVAVLLCSNSEVDDWEAFLAVFPFLLPSSDGQLKVVSEIFETDFIKKNSLLNLNSEIGDSCESVCNNVFDGLKNENSDLVQDFVQALHKTPTEKRDVLHKYLATLLLSCILPQNSPIEISALVIEIFIRYFNTSALKYDKITSLFPSHIMEARQGKFPVEAFLLCMKNVFTKTRKPSVNLSLVDFRKNDDFARFFTSIAQTLFKSVTNYRKYSKVFLDSFCTSVRDKIGFLLNLSICGNENLNEDFTTNSLTEIAKLLEVSQNFSLEKNDVLLSLILSVLLNKTEKVRRKVLDIIKFLNQKKKNYLFSGVLSQSEEIILDEEQLPLVIFNLLGPDSKNEEERAFLRNVLVNAACNRKHPSYLKSHVLKLLSHINVIEIFERTAAAGLEAIAGASDSLDEINSSIVVRNILRCEATIADKIAVDKIVWRFMATCLRNDTLKLNFEKTDSPCVFLLKQLDKEFFSNLEGKVESILLDQIVEVVTLTKNPEVLPAATQIFKHIDLDVNSILDNLVKMRDVHSPKLDLNKLRRRISVVPTLDILDTLEWKKGVTTLELIQDKKKMRNLQLLFPVLFELLKKCLDFDEQTAVEYPKQLILSSILHCCTRTEKELIPENVFNVELIVQCIRASQNPQTHHHALLVLACSAELIPSQVLHHIMAIFTFMGSSVLRHDDAYSFQVISKIINTIIPILVEDNRTETIAKVLRVFVDAVLDVPEHRRLSLYTQLLEQVGVNDYLYVFLLLVFENYISHSQSEDNVKRLDIAADLIRNFRPEMVINTCINLMKFLKRLPDDFENDEALEFGISFKTAKQFRHYKYTLITFTNNLLASKEFIHQIAELSDQETLSLEQLYKDMIICILTYIQRISKVAEHNATTPQAQYWKVVLHHSYDILDSANALLTPQMFLLVIKGLLAHNLTTVRRRALELLNVKLQHSLEFFEECEKQELYFLVPPLLTIIKTINEGKLSGDQELVIQIALLSLKLLVKFLAEDYPEKFTEILEFVVDLTRRAEGNVLASVVLCLAELVTNLRANAISNLPNYMPVLLKIIKQQRSLDSPSLLLLSSVTSMQKIIDTLPLFLSPYLAKILSELSQLTSRWRDMDSDQKLQPVSNKLASIRHKIATKIPARVLIPVIEQTYKQLIEKNCFKAVGPLMDILAETLGNLKGAEVNSNLPELTNFFLNALQFRADQKASLQQANEVEFQVVKALTKLILKLSEGNFRPLYYKLFDWAVRSEVKSERLITFYSLSSEIAECLKGLFVLFAGHFLNNSAQILDSCNTVKTEELYFEDEEKNVLLLESALKTLLAVFTYDNQKFINKDRFEVLMQPLVDQLENTLGGVERLEVRNEEILTPCIVQFAVATADDSLWKQMNYQILLKMRHSSPNVRLIALHCLTDTVKKLGEDFLPLLPETIPFLAELLEDEEEKVENACKRAVQEMEKVLGEPLQKYF